MTTLKMSNRKVKKKSVIVCVRGFASATPPHTPPPHTLTLSANCLVWITGNTMPVLYQAYQLIRKRTKRESRLQWANIALLVMNTTLCLLIRIPPVAMHIFPPTADGVIVDSANNELVPIFRPATLKRN